MATRVSDTDPAPKVLQKVAERKLTGFEMGLRREETLEALARVYHGAIKNYDNLDLGDAIARSEPYGLFALATEDWNRLCETLGVHGKSRESVETVMESAAIRLNANDSATTRDDIEPVLKRSTVIPMVLRMDTNSE